MVHGYQKHKVTALKLSEDQEFSAEGPSNKPFKTCNLLPAVAPELVAQVTPNEGGFTKLTEGNNAILLGGER